MMAGKPRIYSPSAFSIPDYNKIILPNGLPVYSFTGGSGKTLKLEWCFKAGRSSETKQLVSKLTNSLIKEGSAHNTAYQISEHFDYYGSALSHNAGMDYNSYSFYCLEQYFNVLLDKFLELLLEPSFPENELQTIKTNSISRLRQDQDDADFNSYRIITEKIFGSDHPYGYYSTEVNIQSVTCEDIAQHYKKCYLNDESFLIISGGVTQEIIELLSATFSKISLIPSVKIKTVPVIINDTIPYDTRKLDKNQCSVKIGQLSINRLHKDYNGMFIFNTILGGYFNARLSNVIREAKGLTYNIFSTHDTYLYNGIFYISADTTSDQVNKMKKEIYVQIDKMLQKPIAKAELERVRSYLLGMLLTSFDGIYTCSETLRSCLVEGVTFESIQDLINVVSTIDPVQIMETGQRHLNINNLIEVVVG